LFREIDKMATFGLGKPAQTVPPANQIDSFTPWMAASEGNLVLLQFSLTTLSLPVTAADENGYTLLHAAASYNQMEILQFLLGNNVNISAADNDGDAALHYAGNTKTAQFLVQVGKANLNQVNAEGKTALQAKQEELNEMMKDEDVEDDDEDVETLQGVLQYLSSLQ
jgi:ankyrin repeat protein